jgi:hypothetical protein
MKKTQHGAHTGSHKEALIRLEKQIRASQESPVREPLTSRQKYKGYKIKLQGDMLLLIWI